MGQHDLSYRLFFTHHRMIHDLLREIVGEQWVERIDFDSGEKAEGSFVSSKYESRESDVIWKFQRRDGGDPVYVYILLEFQSRPDPSMAVRFMGYVSLFYQNLMSSQPAAERRKLPPVIPILLYGGRKSWNVATDLGSLIEDLDPSAEIYRPQLRYRLVDAAVYPFEKLVALNSPVAELFRIERSRDWQEVRASLPRLRQSIPADEGSLRRTFAAWLQNVILPRFGLFREECSATLTLEELEAKLAESTIESFREGYLEGIQEGEAWVALRQLRLKFGPLEPEVEAQVRSADPDRLLEWAERILAAKSLQEVLQD